jgi:hypothetical protein
MDSRIEELALIISERAEAGAVGDRCHWWRRISHLAREMQTVIDDYRKAYPKEYEFNELAQAQKMAETYKTEMVAARQELARYKEREAVQGWSSQ